VKIISLLFLVSCFFVSCPIWARIAFAAQGPSPHGSLGMQLNSFSNSSISGNISKVNQNFRAPQLGLIEGQRLPSPSQIMIQLQKVSDNALIGSRSLDSERKKRINLAQAQNADEESFLAKTYDPDAESSRAYNSLSGDQLIIADLDESFDEETAADENDALGFLSDDALEIRERFPKGATLSLGASRPWQWINFGYAFYDNSLSLGAGKTTSEFISQNKVISLDLSHYAIGIERRWFPVNEVPFGIFYGLTAGQWQGTTKSNREVGESYSAQGLISFAALGLHVQQTNGWFWGANILGIYKTFIVSQAGHSLDGKVRNYLEEQKALGLPNLSFGRFFQ